MLSTVGVNIAVDYSCQSYQNNFGNNFKFCQQWKVTFLSTKVFRATKFLPTFRANISVAFRATKHLEDTMLPVNYWSWQCTFQSYLKPGRHQASRQLSELTTVSFRATKFCQQRSVQSYQNPVIFKSCHSCS